MQSRAEYLEHMARECRALAKGVKHQEVREQLLAVAEQFELLAKEHRKAASRTIPSERRALKH